MQQESFETILLEAVDDALSSLGESSKEAVYFHLRKCFKIRKNEIPHKIEEFAGAIEKIFGLGASFLEILIMKRLYEKIGSFHPSGLETLSFIEYVAAAKQHFIKMQNEQKNHLQRLILDAKLQP